MADIILSIAIIFFIILLIIPFSFYIISETILNYKKITKKK